eukprot:COSAG01_NODE_11005_length_2028_cov_149.090202_2_plen_63_part_01
MAAVAAALAASASKRLYLPRATGVIGSRWVTPPPAVAGKLRPRRLNRGPHRSAAAAILCSSGL